MMKFDKRPKLALLCLVLLTLACISYSSGDSYGPSCTNVTNYGSQEFVSSLRYYCVFTCPDGSQVVGLRYNDQTYEQLKADALKTCQPPKPTATPTNPPQDTPTPTATVAPAQVLTSKVSACNLIDGFINFELASSAANPLVTLNGYPVKCEVPASNPDVLTCIVPPGQNFPMQVEVQVDGQSTDSFSFDGGGCIQFAPTKANPPQDPPSDGEPTCTGVPPYPEGCTPP